MTGGMEAGALATLGDEMPGAVWTADGDLRITAAFGRVLADRPSVVGTTVYDLVGSLDPQEPAIAAHLAALAGRPRSLRVRVGQRWFQACLAPLHDAAGATVGCIGTALDVTARHRRFRRHERAGAHLAAAQRMCHAGSFEWDAKSGELTCSDELLRILGAERAAVESWPAFLARVHPADADRTAAVVEAARRTGEPFVLEHRVVRPDGSVRELQTRGRFERDASGDATGLMGTSLDVTELHENHRLLERKRALLQATLQATADGLLVVDREGRVITYNDRFVCLWRIPADLVRSRDDEELRAFVVGQLVDGDAFLRGVRRLYAEPEQESFDTLHFRDGRVFERYSRPLRVGERVTGRVWSFRDVTERERALRAREDLLAIVAHEIRSPVTSIHLSVQTLRHPGIQPDTARRALDIVEREDRRLGRFIDELIDMGRIQSGRFELRLEDVDLAEVARGVAEQLGSDLARVCSPLTLQADVPVRGRWDRFRLEEVVTNLLSNAMKFGAGRPIELAVDAVDGRARVRVTDHGVGISPEMLAQIFEPYERAPDARALGGLGLGLYIVKAIVDALGGSVLVESRPGVSTTFTVDLPVEKYSPRGKKAPGVT